MRLVLPLLLIVGCDGIDPPMFSSARNAQDTASVGSGPLDSGDTGAPLAIEIQDVPYSFDGSIYGTADLEMSEACGGTCRRCLYLDSHEMTATVYFQTDPDDEYGGWESRGFFYVAGEVVGSYLIQPNTVWTSVRAQGLFTEDEGSLIVEPITDEVDIVRLVSECPELNNIIGRDSDRGQSEEE